MESCNMFGLFWTRRAHMAHHSFQRRDGIHATCSACFGPAGHTWRIIHSSGEMESMQHVRLCFGPFPRGWRAIASGPPPLGASGDLRPPAATGEHDRLEWRRREPAKKIGRPARGVRRPGQSGRARARSAPAGASAASGRARGARGCHEATGRSPAAPRRQGAYRPFPGEGADGFGSGRDRPALP